MNICVGYDPSFAHHLILGRNSNICERYVFFLLITWFWGTTDQRAQAKFLPRGPKFLSAPLTWSFASGHGHISNSHPDTKYERTALVKSSTYSIFECLTRSSQCLTKGSKNNWKAFRKYSTCCERLIGRMKKKAHSFGRY